MTRRRYPRRAFALKRRRRSTRRTSQVRAIVYIRVRALISLSRFSILDYVTVTKYANQVFTKYVRFSNTHPKKMNTAKQITATRDTSSKKPHFCTTINLPSNTRIHIRIIPCNHPLILTHIYSYTNKLPINQPRNPHPLTDHRDENVHEKVKARPRRLSAVSIKKTKKPIPRGSAFFIFSSTNR